MKSEFLDLNRNFEFGTVEFYDIKTHQIVKMQFNEVLKGVPIGLVPIISFSFRYILTKYN